MTHQTGFTSEGKLSSDGHSDSPHDSTNEFRFGFLQVFTRRVRRTAEPSSDIIVGYLPGLVVVPSSSAVSSASHCRSLSFDTEFARALGNCPISLSCTFRLSGNPSRTPCNAPESPTTWP